MSADRPIRALIIGAISSDLECGAAPAPGGVVHYAGLALARFGAETRVVTSVRNEDSGELLAPLRAEGVEVHTNPSVQTTVCENDYSGDQDAHELRALSDPIGPEGIPPGWEEADLIQLGPLHREDLLPETIAHLRGRIGIDLQGLVREAGPQGTRLASFDRIGEYLRGIDVVKVSEQELPFVIGKSTITDLMRRFGVREWIVTRGARGAEIHFDSRTESVPAVRITQRHPIGAGDVFLATYLYARVKGRPPLRAAQLAARISAEK
ncbi:MAG: hypothetical protein GY946_03780, partial [bacterium]|nr:hypothetical protein [bacterium]